MAKGDPLAKVERAGKRLHRAQAERDAAMADLAEAIRAAVAAGVPKLRVTKAAGVARQTVYDALKE